MVKCNMKGKEECHCGEKNNDYLIGYVYCDHGELHTQSSVCKVICKINPNKRCVE